MIEKIGFSVDRRKLILRSLQLWLNPVYKNAPPGIISAEMTSESVFTVRYDPKKISRHDVERIARSHIRQFSRTVI